MKKASSVIASLLIISTPLIAQSPFTCTTNNGTITITGYTGPGGIIRVPAVINGLPVTTIGPFALQQISGINPPVYNSIIISNGITSLGEYALADNFYMTNVTLPASLTDIGTYAFVDSDSLQSITIPGNVTNIEFGAFYECALTNIAIPGNVSTIGDDAFENCSDLTNVTIESGVASIGDYAFSGTPLSSILIPDSVTNIGVGPYAFEGCSSLTAISVAPGNPAYSSAGGILFNQNQTTLVEYPAGLAGSYSIPNSVASIGDYAFYYCTNLTSVTISNLSNSVTSIGDYSFANTPLASVFIPGGVTNIGGFAFGGCHSLTAITVDPQNQFYTDLGGVLFDSAQTTLVEFPDGVGGSFAIPPGITSLGPGAFDAVSLTNITIPNGVTNIGMGAFESCGSLKQLTIPGTVTSIGDSAFQGSGLTSITIPNGVTSIGNAVFLLCSHLTNVIIPDGVTNIGQEAFLGCSSLTQLTMPNSVTTIGFEAFSDCPGLKAVYFYGNAPSTGSTLFIASSPTVYYLPGTTGWGPTFAGRPTALWTLPYPLILSSGLNFGAQSNQFGFNISWATNLAVVTEACTNLANPVWQPISTNTLTNGLISFSDPNWTNYPARFYRVTYP